MAEQRYETDDYYIYVPSNASDNCDVVVYYPGAGGAHNKSYSYGDYSVFTAAQNFNNNGFHTSNIEILDTSYLLSPDDKGTARGIIIDHTLATNLATNGTSVLIASQYDKKILTKVI